MDSRECTCGATAFTCPIHGEKRGSSSVVEKLKFHAEDESAYPATEYWRRLCRKAIAEIERLEKVLDPDNFDYMVVKKSGWVENAKLREALEEIRALAPSRQQFEKSAAIATEALGAEDG